MSSSASLTTALANHQVNTTSSLNDQQHRHTELKARRLTAPSIVAQVRSLANRTRESIQHSNSTSGAAAARQQQESQQAAAASTAGGSRSASRKAQNRRAQASTIPSILCPTPITMKFLLVVCRCHSDTYQGAIIDGNLDALKDAHEKLSASNIPVEFKELHGSDKKPRLEVHEVAVRHGGARRGSITAPDGQNQHHHHQSHGGEGGGSHARQIGYCPIKTTDILAVLGTHGYDIISSAGMSDGRLLYTLRKP